MVKCDISLGIFSLDNLSVAESGVFRSPPPTVVLFVFPFRSVSICLVYFGACVCMVVVSY